MHTCLHSLIDNRGEFALHTVHSQLIEKMHSYLGYRKLKTDFEDRKQSKKESGKKVQIKNIIL
jgi:hypothetical protein